MKLIKEEIMVELETNIDNLNGDNSFENLNGLSSFVRLIFQTKKHRSFALVYHLLKLACLLHVATATFKGCFSAMKYVKSD